VRGPAPNPRDREPVREPELSFEARDSIRCRCRIQARVHCHSSSSMTAIHQAFLCLIVLSFSRERLRLRSDCRYRFVVVDDVSHSPKPFDCKLVASPFHSSKSTLLRWWCWLVYC